MCNSELKEGSYMHSGVKELKREFKGTQLRRLKRKEEEEQTHDDS